MKVQLLKTRLQKCLGGRGLCTSLYILFLMISAATHSQPVMVSEISNGSKNFIYVGNQLYFSKADSLFKASSTSPATFVAKTTDAITAIYNFRIGSSFFFVTGNTGAQKLWRTDGTAANTVQLATHAQIQPLIIYQSQLYLRVNSTVSGVELWKVDAAYNVTMVKDIFPGNGSGFYPSVAIFNNLLYFFGNDGTGLDLWRTNGTEAGTVLSVDLDDTPHDGVSSWYGLTTVNDIMFFTRNYNTYYDDEGYYTGDVTAELWKTNATAAGTVLVHQSEGYTNNYLSHFLAWNGKLYYFQSIGDYAYHWVSVSDGTTEGTQNLHLSAIDGGPRQLIDAETYLLFYGESQSFTTPIEKTDGTTATEVHEFSEYHSTPSDSQIGLTYTHGRAFFLDDASGYYGGSSQLWQADLASGTTQTVQNIYGFSLHGSGNIVAANESIYFTRTLGNEMTLWHYNPSNPPGSACVGAGSIEREKWTDVPGYPISSIPTMTEDPDAITTLASFTTPRNEGDNYGARVRGYVCVPENGNYVFYISSDDNSELWLSTDDNPANRQLIASSKYTQYNQWDKYPTQTSAAIPLIKGKKYYLEALHKESAGADHLSVGWKLPDGTLERPIPGTRLIPFNRGSAPSIYLSQPDDGQRFTAPANIDIVAHPRDDDGPIVKVEFFASGTLLAEDVTSPYSYRWTNVQSGTYNIEARVTDNEGNMRSDFSEVIVSAPSCEGTGNIRQEIWLNAPGSDVRTFDFSAYPSAYRSFTSFETPQYYANNYASRMRAHICVPQSGNYTLWISSDDYSELYLSTDESETNKRLIAWVYGATKYKDYDKYPTQKSLQINLVAGRKYYIEARHKEGNGNDFVSVGWQLPDGTMERPIAGSRLIPILDGINYGPTIAITSPQPNETFTSPASIRIAANVFDQHGVKSVKFDVTSNGATTTLATFTSAPYEFQWNNVPPGSYQLMVSAADNLNSHSSTFAYFTVNQGACEGTGTIVREIWTGISGTSISSIPVNSAPNSVVQLTSLSTQNYWGNDYGSRIRGYVCAPATGAFTFWIAGDDNSELWLSPNDDPSGKTKIAYAATATRVNEWEKYSSQKSTVINLVQGQRYYIEVLHKEANGADHVAVGWQLPDGTQERPIAGSRLIPFDDATHAAQFLTTNDYTPEDPGSDITVYPNPAAGGDQVSILLPGGEVEDVLVDIVSVTGVSVQNERLSSNGEGVTVGVSASITPGMYLIKVAGSKKRWSKKLQIK